MDDPDSDEAKALETFLTAATWQMTTYVAASFIHDLFLMGIGYVSALLVFIKICIWTDANNALPIRYGWKTMAFSVLTGSMTFLAGQTTSYNMKYVMQMLGFTEHSTTSDANKEESIVTQIDGFVVDIQTEKFTKGASDVTPFTYLVKLAEKWPYFFYLIRSAQTGAPYAYLLTVDAAVFASFVLLIYYFMLDI